MSIVYTNFDFILTAIQEPSEQAISIVHKYDAFLDALTTPDFTHVREAIRQAVHYLITDAFNNTEEAATLNYTYNIKMQKKYGSLAVYLRNFPILDRKSFTIDLATGTGKSWVIYGVAQIMLAEGIVDKVLILCPSLTIEEELKNKFTNFSGDAILTQILTELNAIYPSPTIKNANETILNGDICVENIHAVYQRTGSSIEDSFKGKGERTLVISDEAHHIYSGVDAYVKRWLSFLTDDTYNFRYLIGVTGTPYIEDVYFHDVIYRYSLKNAMEDAIIKKIDYKVEEESCKDKGFDETYQNHLNIQQQYLGIIKPITIIVTNKIVTCIEVWNDLVKYIAEKESLTFEQAVKKVIWVTSGLPSSDHEKEVIQSIIATPEQKRKQNLSALKTVDEHKNPVEWIVSVSMLTEGWDVKNVFQIVPHEQRAFNSKLLISQVLGRGLRIPPGLSHPVYVKINNHEKWTENIVNLYNEVLEIENRLSWGYDESKKCFSFPLYNFVYSSFQDTTEIKRTPAKSPKKVKFNPQSKKWQETSRYSTSGLFRFTVEMKNTILIEQAARQIKLFLKEKDPEVAKQWSLEKIKKYISNKLEKSGYDSSFLSKENISKIKCAFGPMLRDLGRETPRMKMKPYEVDEVIISEIGDQTFSESSIKNKSYLFYSDDSIDTLSNEQKDIFSGFLNDKSNYEELRKSIVKYGGDENEIKFLQERLHYIDRSNFKTPLNLIYVSSEPEYRFTRSVFNNIELFDSVFKSPDKGFYYFPYSYKPSETGSTHIQRENFNPDFFLKLCYKNEILVVEIKKEGDLRQKNKAKLRDGRQHFKALNKKLKDLKIQWEYEFYFLSPENIVEFFQAIRDNRYKGWNSTLMQELS